MIIGEFLLGKKLKHNLFGTHFETEKSSYADCKSFIDNE